MMEQTITYGICPGCSGMREVWANNTAGRESCGVCHGSGRVVLSVTTKSIWPWDHPQAETVTK